MFAKWQKFTRRVGLGMKTYRNENVTRKSTFDIQLKQSEKKFEGLWTRDCVASLARNCMSQNDNRGFECALHSIK